MRNRSLNVEDALRFKKGFGWIVEVHVFDIEIHDEGHSVHFGIRIAQIEIRRKKRADSHCR